MENLYFSISLNGKISISFVSFFLKTRDYDINIEIVLECRINTHHYRIITFVFSTLPYIEHWSAQAQRNEMKRHNNTIRWWRLTHIFRMIYRRLSYNVIEYIESIVLVLNESLTHVSLSATRIKQEHKMLRTERVKGICSSCWFFFFSFFSVSTQTSLRHFFFRMRWWWRRNVQYMNAELIQSSLSMVAHCF